MGTITRTLTPRFNFGVEQAVEEWLADKPHLKLELDTGLCWFVRKPFDNGTDLAPT